MAIFKATYFFQITEYGWTETYYVDKPSMEVAISTFSTLRTERAKLLGAQTQIRGFRCSDVALRGQSKLQMWGVNPARSELGTDNAVNTIYGHYEIAGGGTRRFNLKGAPDDWTQYRAINGKVELVAGAQTIFDDWKNALVDLGIRLRGFNPDLAGGPAGGGVPITAWDRPAPDSVFTRFEAAGAAITKGETVQIKGVIGDGTIAEEQLRYINALHYVWGFAAGKGLIKPEKFNPALVGKLIGGRVVRRVIGYQLIRGGTPIRAGKARVGKYPLVPKVKFAKANKVR